MRNRTFSLFKLYKSPHFLHNSINFKITYILLISSYSLVQTALSNATGIVDFPGIESGLFEPSFMLSVFHS